MRKGSQTSSAQKYGKCQKHTHAKMHLLRDYVHDNDMDANASIKMMLENFISAQSSVYVVAYASHLPSL
jgi:hypothetical protein